MAEVTKGSRLFVGTVGEGPAGGGGVGQVGRHEFPEIRLTRTGVRIRMEVYSIRIEVLTPVHYPDSPVATGCSVPQGVPPEGPLAVQLDNRSCPRCGSAHTHRFGWFPLKDGTRQPRWRCVGCKRTFSLHTGTPLLYIKKRVQWFLLVSTMAHTVPLRRAAADLGVHVATTFDWRHRTLGPLSREPQHVLSGSVFATEAYVPYSEKGKRLACRHQTTDTAHVLPHNRQQPFRRLKDGKPSCVLLVAAEQCHAVLLAGKGRPSSDMLQASLAPLLGAGAELCADGLAPYARVCQELGIPFRAPWSPGDADLRSPYAGRLENLRRQLHGWLLPFCGVATRYLHHYLAWYRFAGRIAGIHPADLRRRMVRSVVTPVCPSLAA